MPFASAVFHSSDDARSRPLTIEPAPVSWLLRALRPQRPARAGRAGPQLSSSLRKHSRRWVIERTSISQAAMVSRLCRTLTPGSVP